VGYSVQVQSRISSHDRMAEVRRLLTVPPRARGVANVDVSNGSGGPIPGSAYPTISVSSHFSSGRIMVNPAAVPLPINI
jgi:hypothetical protein